jgi:hypothetical protein
MKEFGESVGICLHYSTADEIASELADKEIANGNKKKKEQIVGQLKKDLNLKEQIRVLIFKDGMCVSDNDYHDKDKIKLDSKFEMFLINII